MEVLESRATGSLQNSLNQHQEEVLVRLAREGGQRGRQARTRLVEQHYPWIWKRCLQVLGSEADANDAAQEVAVRAYKALSRFESRSSIRTWLYTIVHNECVSLIRKRQSALLSDHVKELITLYELQQRSDVHDLDPACDSVRQTLEALPAKAREILQFRFFGELSLEEMGAVLDLSLSATKMRLYRALEHFKQLYPQVDNSASVNA